MQLSNTLLRSISKSIETGRPLNAILRAAEYLDSSDPIFAALVAQAQPVLERDSRYRKARALIAEVLCGRRLSTFPSASKALLLSIRESTSAKNFLTAPINPVHFSARGERRGTNIGIARAETVGARAIGRFPRVALAPARTFGSAR